MNQQCKERTQNELYCAWGRGGGGYMNLKIKRTRSNET